MNYDFSEKVHLLPYDVKSNDYIEQTKKILGNAGYSVCPPPRNFSDFFYLIYSRFFNKGRHTIIINWYEDMPSQVKFSLLRFIFCLFYFVALRLSFSKIIWLRHNFSTHNKALSLYFDILSFILRFCSDTKITHRPINGFEFLPHPIYSVSSSIKPISQRSIDYFIFGSIEPYKGVVELLKSWPYDKKLLIVGRCKSILLDKQIVSIINDRSINVEYRNEFLETNELNSLILSSKCVILPHSRDEMIVSGVFYHAASFGANILQNKNNFSSWCSNYYSFSNLFDCSNIADVLNQHELVQPEDIINELTSTSGLRFLGVRWKRLLEQK